MTASDVLAEMRVEKWATPRGFSSYEVSNGQPLGDGKVRSVDRRLANGRRMTSQPISRQKSTRGYPKVTIRDDDGERVTIEVHRLQALAFEKNGIPRGMEVRHWNDVPTDNRWAPGGEENCGPGKPGNVLVGTRAENDADRLRNNPEGIPRPLGPPADCSYCGERPAKGRGWCQRCYQRWYDAGRPESGPPPAPEQRACGQCSRSWSRRVADTVSRWLSR